MLSHETSVHAQLPQLKNTIVATKIMASEIPKSGLMYGE